MKVTIENIKGLNKDLKVFIDKKTMNTYMEEKYEEIKNTVNLKGFRPGKVPREVLKRQFGKAIFNEVLDKVLKDTSTKALEKNKIKPAGQPKLDLKIYGEDKDLEYVISVTELPKVEIKSLENIKYDDYHVKIDALETDKRIKEIAKNQNNFIEINKDIKSSEGNLVVFDYKAKIDNKDFKGGEGKNTQLILGKDLFIKGFDNQLLKVKKNEEKIVTVKLPENYPNKEYSNKEAKFNCKILNIKKAQDVKIDDVFAKSLGAKDLKDLKQLISKQISEQYKQTLDSISKNEILDQIDKFKEIKIPEGLVEQELKILSEAMSADEKIKNKNDNIEKAKKRIKIGLILNEFGAKNNVTVGEDEIKKEIQKQIQMMPGQEKMVIDYYQKNPQAAASLRGGIYEEKIISLIKEKSKTNKKTISTEEAEKIILSQNEKDMKKNDKTNENKKKPLKKSPKVKKVSKK